MAKVKAKTKTMFFCTDCGAEYPQWQGQCTACLAWNTIQAEPNAGAATKAKGAARLGGYAGSQATLTSLADVQISEQPRLKTGLSEFDHVLGGGLVSDSVVLIGGDPGIGKSTLLLQVMAAMAGQYSALYVTGEESLQQVAMRAERLQVPAPTLSLLAETQVERIIEVARDAKPKMMVIDSIQTIFSDSVSSAPGSVSQVRESAAELVRFAKQSGTALLLVGHVNKEGAIAGPRILEHMVDTVLYFEGQSDSRYRVIRAVKNRFGAVNELGVFAMTDRGLREVSNPSAIFLSQYDAAMPGSAVMVTWEGTRPLLVEVQALVDETHLPQPRRVAIGLDPSRLSMLLAILNRHGGLATHGYDVFVNVVGGLKITETAADLAMIAAVRSSLQNRLLPSGLMVMGEVGLSGEVRPVPSGQERLREAAKHGFSQAIVPKGNMPKSTQGLGMEVVGVENLSQFLDAW